MTSLSVYIRRHTPGGKTHEQQKHAGTYGVDMDTFMEKWVLGQEDTRSVIKESLKAELSSRSPAEPLDFNDSTKFSQESRTAAVLLDRIAEGDRHSVLFRGTSVEGTEARRKLQKSFEVNDTKILPVSSWSKGRDVAEDFADSASVSKPGDQVIMRVTNARGWDLTKTGYLKQFGFESTKEVITGGRFKVRAFRNGGGRKPTEIDLEWLGVHDKNGKLVS